MAYEPRLAIGFPGDAGSLGTKMNRRHWGQDLENSTGANEYHWMAGTFFKWAGELTPGQYLPRKIENCPVDAHSLLALCAPRPMLLDGGTKSTWCDPYGVYLTTYYATPVYELFGLKGMVMPDPKPIVDKAYIDGTIAYRVHEGGHTDAPEWPSFFKLAAKHFDITTLVPSVSSLTISPKANSSATFSIFSNRDWTVSCSEKWLNVNARSSHESDSVTVTAVANSEKSARTAVLTIKTSGREQIVYVNQASLKPELALSSKDLIIGATDKSLVSFDVKSNTSWNIVATYEKSSNSAFSFFGPGNWLTINDDAGINTKSISLIASANPGIQKRSVKITVSATGVTPKTLTVTQSEGAPTLNIMTDSINLNAKESTASLMIMSNTTWNLTCSEPWLSANPVTGGNFSQVTVSAKDNTGAEERKAVITLTVTGLPLRVITVTQKAASIN